MSPWREGASQPIYSEIDRSGANKGGGSKRSRIVTSRTRYASTAPEFWSDIIEGKSRNRYDRTPLRAALKKAKDGKPLTGDQYDLVKSAVGDFNDWADEQSFPVRAKDGVVHELGGVKAAPKVPSRRTAKVATNLKDALKTGAVTFTAGGVTLTVREALSKLSEEDQEKAGLALAGFAGLASLRPWKKGKKPPKGVPKRIPHDKPIKKYSDALLTYEADRLKYEAYDNPEYGPPATRKKTFSGLEDTPLRKDILSPMGQLRDMERNMQKVFPEKDHPVHKEVVEPWLKGKERFVDDFERNMESYQAAIEKKLKIKPHSKADEAVFRLAQGEEVDKLGRERAYNRQHVVAEFGERRAQDIEQAANWYRNFYDKDIHSTNKVIRDLYGRPNQFVVRKKGQDRVSRVFDSVKEAREWMKSKDKSGGQTELKLDIESTEKALKSPDGKYEIAVRSYVNKKLIQKRRNYMRHFQDPTGFSALANLFEGPTSISASLAGVSAHTKPRSRWLSVAQRRFGNLSQESAAGGWINYMQQTAAARHIDPIISNTRAFTKQLAETTEGYNNLNNLIAHLDDWSNDIAGKTNLLDRGVQRMIGRRGLGVLNFTNNRIKANVILGNASSSLAQAFNVPQAAGGTRQYMLVGAQDALASPFNKKGFAAQSIKKSPFIRERYMHQETMRFKKGWLTQRPYVKEGAAWMIGVLDEAGTKLIWHSFHRKAIGMGEKNPIKYADEWTRKMVAGRGIGEVPIGQKSKVVQLIAPFTLEVGNMWYAMKDVHTKSGKTGGMALSAIPITLATSYLMNEASEHIRGSRVSFDPVDALINGLKQAENPELDTGEKLLTLGAHLVGEVIGNVPGGQSAGFMIPYKWRKKYFGDSDPTKYARFGEGALPGVLEKGIKDPLTKLTLPFGGQQVERTIQGVQAYREGGPTTSQGKQAPVKKSLMTAAQMAAFGKWSPDEVRAFFKKDESPSDRKVRPKKVRPSRKLRPKKRNP